jgi:phenylpropionate dioxygenase-like ring-hydroxylating dioxygenase large terminal subunit
MSGAGRQQQLDELLIGLTRRMIDLLDRRATDLAPAIKYEPIDAYTSTEQLARERSAIFARTPMLIGMSADIPSPGSWRALDLADTPMLLCRDQEGQPRLYLNSCRHRGVKLVEGAGQTPSFTCPFHGWRYDLDGTLRGVPEPEGFEGLCREEHGLIPLPVAEKYGVIFGCATPGASLDVDELLGGLGPELALWDLGSYSLYRAHHAHFFTGNWKSAWDTFCENYHFAFLHSTTLSDYIHSRRQAVDFYGPNVRMVSALRTIDAMREQPEKEWEPARHISVQYRLYPTVSLSVYPEKNEVYWVFPGRAPDEGYAIHAVYVAEEPRTDEERKKLDEAITFGCETVVTGEDLWIAGQSALGFRAPARSDHVVFGRNEPVVQHFHRCFEADAAEAERDIR